MNMYFDQEDSNIILRVDTEKKVKESVMLFRFVTDTPVVAACMRDWLQDHLDKNMEKLCEKMVLHGYKLGCAKKGKPTLFSEAFDVKPDDEKETW